MAWRKDVRIPHYEIESYNFLIKSTISNKPTHRWKKFHRNICGLVWEYEIHKHHIMNERVSKFIFIDHTFYYFNGRSITEEESQLLIEYMSMVGDFEIKMDNKIYELSVGFLKKLKHKRYNIDFIMSLQLIDLHSIIPDKKKVYTRYKEPKEVLEQMADRLLEWTKKEYKKRGLEKNVDYVKLFEDWYV